MLALLKYLPLILSTIEAITNLLDFMKKRKRAIQAGQNTEVEDKQIKKNREKLVEIGERFLPDNIRATATNVEINAFTGAVIDVVEDIITLIEKFIPLTQK